jgi:phosphoserine phosphatase
MKRPVVFDFDKTLTKEDTLVGFYRETSISRTTFNVKLPLLWMAAIFYKIGFISNDTLKKIGVWLYLKGLKKEDIKKFALKYSSKIKLNEIYKNDFLNYPPEDVIIISASFEDYLKPIFSNYKVVGSTLEYDGETLVGMSTNMYGNRKKEWLSNRNIENVEVFYTDSLSDQPVIEISATVYLVDKGSKRELKIK